MISLVVSSTYTGQECVLESHWDEVVHPNPYLKDALEGCVYMGMEIFIYLYL